MSRNYNIKRNLVLDCDTGEDDALAILLAITEKLPLCYIVTSFGNTSLENATRNTSRLISLARAEKIKVVRGSKKPIHIHYYRDQASAGDFVGKNGICNTDLPPSTFDNVLRFSNEEFPFRLLEIIKKEAPLDYIITGPCTNFARLCTFVGPEIKKYVHRLYIMGGAIYTDGNTGPLNPITGKPYAEFNFFCDPFAADIVVRCGIPIHLISWDVTSTVTLSYRDIHTFQSNHPIGRFTLQLMNNFFTYYGLTHDRNFELNDPLTIMAFLGYGSHTTETIRVITEKHQFGRSVLDENETRLHYYTLTEEEKKKIKDRMLTDLRVSVGIS